MKRHPSPRHRSAIILPVGRVRLGWLLVTFWLFTPQLIFGTDRHWTGATNTTWSTSTNWDTAPPGGTSDNAVFDSTFNSSNQPSLTSTATVGGLWMVGSVGRNVTISGSTLTLGGGTINGNGSVAILMDSAVAFTLTINNSIFLNNFTFGGTKNLTLGTGQVILNTSPITITLNGTGSTLTLGGTIAGGGADRTLMVNGAGNTLSLGALTISSNNTARTFTIAGTGDASITGVVASGGTSTSNLTYGDR